MTIRKDTCKYYLFIEKLRNYEVNLVQLIENILGVPKFKIGDLFRITTKVKNLNLHRECQIYNISKIWKKYIHNTNINNIKMNYYKYHYINRISGKIGYEINEDKMIHVKDQKVLSDKNNIWI